MSTDLSGRAYATVSEVTDGTLVEVDGDFGCLPPWSKHFVGEDDQGLYIGHPVPDDEIGDKHYLDGQLDDSGTYYVGVYIV